MYFSDLSQLMALIQRATEAADAPKPTLAQPTTDQILDLIV